MASGYTVLDVVTVLPLTGLAVAGPEFTMWHSLAVLLGLAGIGYGLWRGYQQMFWKPVMGRIEEVWLEKHELDDGDNTGDDGAFGFALESARYSYVPHVTYSYTYNGRSYTGQGTGSSSKHEGQAYSRYSVGSSTALRVNPAKPQQSVLALGINDWLLAVGAVVGGVLLLLVVSMGFMF